MGSGVDNSLLREVDGTAPKNSGKHTGIFPLRPTLFIVDWDLYKLVSG